MCDLSLSLSPSFPSSEYGTCFREDQNANEGCRYQDRTQTQR